MAFSCAFRCFRASSKSLFFHVPSLCLCDFAVCYGFFSMNIRLNIAHFCEWRRRTAMKTLLMSVWWCGGVASLRWFILVGGFCLVLVKLGQHLGKFGMLCVAKWGWKFLDQKHRIIEQAMLISEVEGCRISWTYRGALDALLSCSRPMKRMKPKPKRCTFLIFITLKTTNTWIWSWNNLWATYPKRLRQDQCCKFIFATIEFLCGHREGTGRDSHLRKELSTFLGLDQL